MPEADEAILIMKCDCAARWSLTAIKRVLDNSTPEGLLRRAGLHDFGLPVFSRCIVGYRQDRAISPDHEAVLLLWDYPMGAATCYAASSPHTLRRVAVRGGSCLYKNRRRITRQRQNEIVNFKICMTCRITAAWIGIDAKVYMIHGTIDFMLTCLIS